MTCLRFTETCSKPHWAAYLDIFSHFLLKYAALSQVYTTRLMLLSFELARLSATTSPRSQCMKLVWNIFDQTPGVLTCLCGHNQCLMRMGPVRESFGSVGVTCPFGSMVYVFFYFPFPLNAYMCLTNIEIWFLGIWSKIQLVNILKLSVCFAEVSWLFCDNLGSISERIINQSCFVICRHFPASVNEFTAVLEFPV